MSETLSDWLLECIAEDEERADFVRRQIEGTGWTPSKPWMLSWHDEYDLLCIEPSRVLAECESKRRILDLYPSEHHDEMLYRLLALPYADRPGWREEWRP